MHCFGFHAEKRADFLDGFLRRRGDALECRGGGRPRGRRRKRFGHFDIGRVIRSVGKRDGVLARIGQHLEFVAGVAADRAGVGLHRAEPQAEPRENARVGVVHVAVFERGRRLVQQHDARAAEQADGDVDALGLPEREPLDGAVERVAERDGGRQLGDLGLRLRHAARGARRARGSRAR